MINARIPPFDIFRKAEGGQPMWEEAALTLEAAELRVRQLCEAHPGEYIILNQTTGHQVSIGTSASA